jgi:hypothetical protein
MSYHIDILAIDFDRHVGTVVARLTLGEPAGVIFESIHDETWSRRLLRTVGDGFGGVVTPRDDPRLYLHRYNDQLLSDLEFDGVLCLPQGPHDGDACDVQIGASFPTEPSVPTLGDWHDLPVHEGNRCSFCGKRVEQVHTIIAGPGTRICDECLDTCNRIVQEEFPSWRWRSVSSRGVWTNTPHGRFIPAEAEEELASLWREFGERKEDNVRERLLVHYLPLVRFVADVIRMRELSDLIDIGRPGLLEALDDFHPDRGDPFEPFALKRITEAILDELRLLRNSASWRD